MNKKIVSILVCVIFSVLAFGSSLLAQEKDALDLAVERGKLYVSTELGNAPWAFEDPKTGEITGFTIELVKMYAEELGIGLEVKTFDWAGIIPSLTTGKVDMVAAPLSRTIPRSVNILYCEPYVIDPGVGYALKGKFKDLSELNKEGIVITTTAGSVHEIKAKELFPEATISPLATVADTTAAVLAGRADVSLTSKIVAEQIIQANPNLEIIPGGYTFMDSFACAVRFDSFKLWTSFNMFMRMIKLDGRYAQLYEKWLGIEWQPISIETAL